MDSYGFTPARRAVSRGNAPCVGAFIEAGFDINTKRGLDGLTVLYQAIMSGVAMMRYLINKAQK